MSAQITTELEEQRRIRDEISRLRRRLDRRVDRIVDRGLLFGSWREYVISHPVRSLTAAAGVGMVFGGLTPGWSSRCGQRIYDAAIAAAWPQIWREVQSFVSMAKESFDEQRRGDAGNA